MSASDTSQSFFSTHTSPAMQESNVSKTDPSLLHQLSVLQKENQELLQMRNTLENTVKECDTKLQEVTASYEREKAEHTEIAKKEMQGQFETFMVEWIKSMDKQNPEVVARMKNGIDQLISQGRKKDGVWEVLCCASENHANNVAVIEQLTLTNKNLLEKNKELLENCRQSQGFETSTTLGKRKFEPNAGTSFNVNNDTTTTIPLPSHADSDVWKQFEVSMQRSNY